jgi:hypothetical protein
MRRPTMTSNQWVFCSSIWLPLFTSTFVAVWVAQSDSSYGVRTPCLPFLCESWRLPLRWQVTNDALLLLWTHFNCLQMFTRPQCPREKYHPPLPWNVLALCPRSRTAGWIWFRWYVKLNVFTPYTKSPVWGPYIFCFNGCDWAPCASLSQI